MHNRRRQSSSLMLLPGAAMVTAIVVTAAVTLSSCKEEEKNLAPAIINPESTPTMLTTDVSSFISDSGYTRYHIVSPTWKVFDNAEIPTWKFPDGLQLDKFDDDMNTTAKIVCDSATYFSAKKLWRLDGNVRMRNTEGDRFLTQQIFWDQQSRTVYSDSFIHIEKSNRIIEGYGFLSNEQMTAYTVRRPSGIFPVPERKDKDHNDLQQQ